VARIEGFHEAERAVIQCQAENRHIVGIHYAVHETDGLPLRHQVRGAARDFGQQCGIGIGFI